MQETYDEHLSGIPTERFSEMVDQIKIDPMIGKKAEMELPVDGDGVPIPPPDIPFDSQSDVPPLIESPIHLPIRPSEVP